MIACTQAGNGVVRSFRLFPEIWSVAILSAAFTGAILLTGINGYPGGTDPSCREDENGVVVGYCFCEQDTGGLVRQPINSASCYAFVAGALLIGCDAGRRRLKKTKKSEENDEPEREYVNIMTETMYYPVLYSNVLASVGPASVALHASLKAWGGKIDMIFVILLLNLIFTISLGRLLGPKFLEIRNFSIMGSVTTIFTQVLQAQINTSYYMMTALGVGGIVCEALNLCIHRIQIKKLIYVASVVLVFTAGAFRYVDDPYVNDGKICDPTSFFQPHALWHALAAVSGTLLYFYVCTEVPRPKMIKQSQDTVNRESIGATAHVGSRSSDDWMDEEGVP
mmetsp:Transcript_11725/g.25415  ORF Transcript_11725/g.25415 Transcript_11725/m.25415 type:complete len:337 (-) Transcript_11725:51-1061(-)